MKLDKQNNNETLVTLPLPASYLPTKSVSSLSEKELQELLPKLVQVLQKRISKRPEWWPRATGLPWTLTYLPKVIKDANLSSLRTLVQKCCDYLNHGTVKPTTPPQAVIAPRVLDWLCSTSPSCASHTILKGMVSSELYLPGISSQAVTAMTECELRELLPKLVEVLQRRYLSKCPEWWPHFNNLPWTLSSLQKSIKDAQVSSIRALVLLCCQYLNQNAPEMPLQTLTPMQPQPRVIHWLNSSTSSDTCTAAKAGDYPVPAEKEKAMYLDIYLCYQCNEEFSCKDMLQKHQAHCKRSVVPIAIPSTPPASEAPSPTPPTVMSDDASSTSTGIVYPVSRNEFMSAVDLVSTKKALRLRCSKRRNTECEAIDLEEPQTPISPNSPRTPKLLISQLSRDTTSNGSGTAQLLNGRRRLSYVRQLSEKRSVDEHIENDEDREDSETSDSSGDEDAEDEPKLLKKSLLMIDVSSALGQRVLKHMSAAAEVKVPVVPDAESFCKTPIKDKYHDRLRLRHPVYPITWKLTKIRMRQQAFCHVFKFTRADKEEFMEKMKTGLNWECRQLLKCVKKCSVTLKRLSRKTLYKWKPSLNKITVPVKQLTAEEVRHWTQPKPVTPQPSIFPDGPTFLFTDIDRVLGLKRKDGVPVVSRKLLTSHCVSETDNAELQLQKLTVYRSLLTDLSSCSVSDKAENENEKLYPTLFSILSSGAVSSAKNVWKQQDRGGVNRPLKIEIPATPSRRPALPKFNHSSPLEDGFSIISVSSSDEEVSAAACCTFCRRLSNCFCPPTKVTSLQQDLPGVGMILTPKPEPALTVTEDLGEQITVPSPGVISSPSSDDVLLLADSPESHSCPTSPTPPSVHLVTRSSTVSPNTSKSSKVRSSVTLRTSNKQSLARPSDRKTKAIDECEGKSAGLLQPLSKHHTRSSSRESASGISENYLLNRAGICVKKNNSRHTSVSPNATTRRENRIDDVHSAQSLQGDDQFSCAINRKLSGGSRTLRRGGQENCASLVEPGSLSDKTKRLTSDNSTLPNPNTRRSGRFNNNPFEKVVDSKGDASCENRGLKRTAQDAFSNTQQGINKDKVATENPFVKSKVQTKLFTTSVLQQARRSWRPVSKSPVRDSGAGTSKAVLRSGATFRLASAALSSAQTQGQTISSTSEAPFTTRKWKRGKSLSLVSSENGNIVQSAAGLKTPPRACSSLSLPAKKGLSPQEMLTVLESTKGRGSMSRTKGPLASEGKRVGCKRKMALENESITIKAGYVTRAKEAGNKLPPKKNA